MAGITLGVKALYDFGKASIKVASDLEEIQNVVNVTFGSMSDDVGKFSKTLIDSHGLGELSAKKYASYMGAMLKSSGIHGDVVKDMSMDLTKLTADMASFYNLDTEEMFQKIMSGMSGATMPLKKLGINMNIANLEAFALAQGIGKSWKEMSQAEQTMVRYNYLLNVTSDSQGDFARNSDNWAHSVKILGEKWKEFMGIVGNGLQKIILPLVKGLIKVLDILIAIGRAVEKVFVMITGKKVDVEPREVGIVDDYTGAMDDLGDFSKDAAEGQKKLGKGIKDAAKAAKGALAPFDELNILQQNLAGGSKGGAGGGLGSPFDGINFNNDFKMDPVGDSLADGFKKLENDGNRFFIWFGDKWNKLREMLSIPLVVAQPVLPTLPVPIFEPEWGLDIPHIPSPIFPPIPSPVYRPNWGLDTPKVPAPVFMPIPNPVYEPVWNLIPPPVPAVNYLEYASSLESLKIKTAEIFEGIKINTENVIEKITTSVVTGYEKMKEGAIGHAEKLRQGQSELWEKVRVDTETVTGKIQTGLSTAWSTVETNFKTHKENIGKIAGEISTTLVKNINTGLSTMGANFNKTIETVQTNLQTFGKNVGAIAGEAARTFSANFSEGFKTTSQNIVSFANAAGQNIKSFGEGMLRIGAETARGFASNMASGLSTAWENFKNFASAIGEKVGGWFSANKKVIATTAIAVPATIAAVHFAPMALPVIAKFVGEALGGLSAIPALAKGGITDGPMLAMIGDNPGGKEVVSPLDGLLDMIVEAVNISSNNNGGNINLVVKIGEDTIGEKAISYINDKTIMTGESPILI